MRGGVETDLEVGFGLIRTFSGVLGEDCGDECGGRALAFRAGDMNCVQPI